LNEADKVYAWLERALAARDGHLIYVPVDPKWDPFRREERFLRLLRRSGLLPPVDLAPRGSTYR
jgi:hypothetical protein